MRNFLTTLYTTYIWLLFMIGGIVMWIIFSWLLNWNVFLWANYKYLICIFAILLGLPPCVYSIYYLNPDRWLSDIDRNELQKHLKSLKDDVQKQKEEIHALENGIRFEKNINISNSKYHFAINKEIIQLRKDMVESLNKQRCLIEEIQEKDLELQKLQKKIQELDEENSILHRKQMVNDFLSHNT